MNIKTECLICTRYHVSQAHFAKCIVDSTDVYRKSANHWTINQKISQYCLSCALNSNVKQPPGWQPSAPSEPPQTLLEGHLALLAHWTSPWGRRVRFWLRLWASVCKVTAASLVAPTAASGTEAARLLRCHPAGGEASQLPCDGSFRQRVSTCHQPSTQSHYGGGYSVPVGGKGLQAKGEELDSRYRDVSYTSARRTPWKTGSVYSVSVFVEW